MSKKKKSNIIFNAGDYEYTSDKGRVLIHIPTDIPVDKFQKGLSKVFLSDKETKAAS